MTNAVVNLSTEQLLKMIEGDSLTLNLKKEVTAVIFRFPDVPQRSRQTIGSMLRALLR